MIRKAALVLLAAWIARWAAREAAGCLGYVLPPRNRPLDSPRPPGWMPRRLDSLNE